jgi:hypothetical protein
MMARFRSCSTLASLDRGCSAFTAANFSAAFLARRASLSFISRSNFKISKRNYLQLLLEAQSTDNKVDVNTNEIIDYAHNQFDKKLTIEVRENLTNFTNF